MSSRQSAYLRLPAAVQRRNLRWLLAIISGFVVVGLGAFLLNGWLQFLGGTSAAILSFLPCVAFFLLQMWLSNRLDTKLLERLTASGDRLCPNCLYDLSGGEDAQVCPECGTAYTQESLSDSWGAYRVTMYGPARDIF